jgi:large subunit ribosomal protein L10
MPSVIARGRPQHLAKQRTVAELAEGLRTSASAVLVDFRGLRVVDEAELRRRVREAGATYRVVKNTLLRLAARGAGLEGLEPLLEGQTAVAFSWRDPTDAARVMVAFAREFPALRVKGGVLGGRVLGPDEVQALAELPSREVLLARVAGAFAAPLAAVAMAWSAPLRALGAVVSQLAKSREGGQAA